MTRNRRGQDDKPEQIKNVVSFSKQDLTVNFTVKTINPCHHKLCRLKMYFLAAFTNKMLAWIQISSSKRIYHLEFLHLNIQFEDKKVQLQPVSNVFHFYELLVSDTPREKLYNQCSANQGLIHSTNLNSSQNPSKCKGYRFILHVYLGLTLYVC